MGPGFDDLSSRYATTSVPQRLFNRKERMIYSAGAWVDPSTNSWPGLCIGFEGLVALDIHRYHQKDIIIDGGIPWLFRGAFVLL